MLDIAKGKALSIDLMLPISLGALLHATWNAFVRSATDKFLDTVLVTTGAGVFAACWLPFVALPLIASWPYLIASIVIHLGYFAVVALAYHHAELSFAYPIMRGTAPVSRGLLSGRTHQPSALYVSPNGHCGSHRDQNLVACLGK